MSYILPFKKIWCLLVGLLLTSSASLSSPSDRWSVDFSQGTGSSEFKAIGRPSAIKVNGKGAGPRGIFKVHGTRVTGVATVDLNSLDTGIELRNKHMKEKYLQTDKYPEAKLTISKMELPSSGAGATFTKEGVPFDATLQVHGEERPVSGTARIEKSAASVSIEARFGIKVSDYKIEAPSFAGVTVADDVEIVIQGTAPVQAAEKGR